MRTRRSALVWVLALLTCLAAVVVVPPGQAEAVRRHEPPRPVVTGLSRDGGPTSGGTRVLVAGRHLRGVTEVRFGRTRSPRVKLRSDHLLKVVAPVHAAGRVLLRLVSPAGRSRRVTTAHFTYVDATPPHTPVVTGLSPAQGPPGGGTRVRVRGRHFDGATTVDFGGTLAVAEQVSATALEVTSPAHAPGTVEVSVATPEGSSRSGPAATFEYVSCAPPEVTSLAANEGPIDGGTESILSGHLLGGVTEVRFGEVTAAFIAQDADHLLVTPPPHPIGEVDVHVASVCGQSSPLSYRYVASVPVVTSVSPNRGPAYGGNEVVVRGSGFHDVGDVEVGGVSLDSWTVVSPTELRIEMPAGAGETYIRVVTSEGGSGSEATDATRYTYEASVPSVGAAVDAALPANGAVDSAVLSALACPSPGGCIAVGSYRSHRRGLPLIEHQETTGWVGGTVPLPADADPDDPQGRLLALACPGAHFCAAVGDYYAAGEYHPLLATWDGSTWSVTTVEAPRFADEFYGFYPKVGCTAAETCAALASGSAALTFVDGRWRREHLPVSADAMLAVDCTQTECVAVGATEALTQEGQPRPATLRWSGGTWSASEPPQPPDAAALPFAFLSAVSCPTDGECVAVGSYSRAYDAGFEATLRGGAWTSTRLPEPDDSAGQNAFAKDVDCITVESCVAVEDYVATSRFPSPGSDPVDAVTMIELVGGTWRASPVPLPDADLHHTYAQVQAVECSAPGSCVALGTYALARGRTRGLVATIRDGAVGPTVQVATPAAAREPGLVESYPGFVGLALDSATTAVGIGAYIGSDADAHAMIVTGLPVN